MKKLFFAVLLITSCFTSLIYAQIEFEQPVVVKAVSPTYIPPAALAFKAEGKVQIEVKINEKGEVESTKSISGHRLLQGLAEKFAAQWLFNKDDKSEKNRLAVITFVFHLVSSQKEESTLFFPPYQVELFYHPLELITEPSIDPASIPLKEKQPKVLKYIAPKYPPSAQAIAAMGEVIVAVKINKAGKVISAIAESGHPLLRKSSENAAKDWTFSNSNQSEEREVKINFVYRIEKNKNKSKFKKPYRLEIIAKTPKSAKGLPVLQNANPTY